MDIFTIDGKDFSASVIDLTRKFNILDGPNAGRTLDGNMHRDIIGTYFPYSVTISSEFLSPTQYDDFYEIITAPVNYHKVKFPYGQTVYEFNMYVTSGSDKLIRRYNNQNYWDDITLEFVTMKPLKRP